MKYFALPTWLIRLIACGYILSLFLIGMWPFKFISVCFSNKISWLQSENGVEISSCGELVSKIPPIKLYDAFRYVKGFTLETYLQVNNNHQRGPARIISYSTNASLRNFTLGQSNDSLVLRLRTTKSDLNGTNPHFAAEKIFDPSKRQLITLTYDGRFVRLYLNGVLKKESNVLGGDFSNWDSEAFLLFGNETSLDRLWKGNLFFVAVYNRALDDKKIFKHYELLASSLPNNLENMYNEMGILGLYDFSNESRNVVYDKSTANKSGDLVPETFRTYISYLNIIQPDPFDVADMLKNMLGFAPLSFLIFGLIQKNRNSIFNIYFWPLLTGCIISLSIESIQILLIGRFFSFLDVIYNISGAAIGSVILHFFAKKKAKLLLLFQRSPAGA